MTPGDAITMTDPSDRLDGRPDTRSAPSLRRRIRGPERTDEWILAAQIAVVLATVSIGAIAVILGDWRPVGDIALTTLRIDDVGGSNTPLLGAWSRWGWAHPGPLMFWLLAVPASVLGDDERSTIVDWRQSLTFTLLEAVEQHPLAKRLLGGLEPEVTARVLQIPALADLRVACAERLRADQLTGRVRADIDPVSTANGVVAIILSLLMSLVQLGPGITAEYADDVTAVFGAALDPPR